MICKRNSSERMANAVKLCLIFFYIIFANHAESQTIKGNDLTLTLYGCKGLYEFHYEVENVIFTSALPHTLEEYNSTNYSAVLKFPADTSATVLITLTNSTGTFRLSISQSTSKTCCNDTVFQSGSCYTLGLTCPGNCTKWPEYPEFYQASNCQSCSCQICYDGINTGWKRLLIPLLGQTHLFNIKVPDINMIPAAPVFVINTTLVQPYRFAFREEVDLLPLPENGLIKNYFDIYPVKGTYEMKVKSNKTLPSNGRSLLYFQSKASNTTIWKYTFIWYSRLACKIASLSISYLSDPFKNLTCENPLQIPITYSVSNSAFQMIGNELYLKELMTIGSQVMDIFAMYVGLPNSQIQFRTRFQLSVKNAILKVYGCKADVNFGYLNYKRIDVVNKKSGLNFTLFSKPSSYLINLLPNQQNTFELFLDGQKSSYQMTATSSGSCCNDTVVYQKGFTCFQANFTCPNTCEVTTWPEHKKFLKSRACTGCTCQYCYIANTTGVQQFDIPLRTYTHIFQINITTFTSTTLDIIVPVSTLYNRVSLYKDSNVVIVPSPAYGSFLQYFQVISVQNSLYFQIKPDTNIPSEGQVLIYIYSQQERRSVNIIWYSKIHCNTTELPAQYLNEPLLEVNCVNNLPLPIEYLPSSDIFQMKDNLLYLRNLTAKLPDIFSLKVQYVSHPLSSSLINNITIPKALQNVSFLTVHGCKAAVNFNLLNYTRINIYNQQHSFNISLIDQHYSFILDLIENKWNTFELYLPDQNATYTITAKSADVCCKDRISQLSHCHTVNLTCPDICRVMNWLDYPDFYKASDCNNCTCEYCYVGNISAFYELIVHLISSTHLVAMNVSRVDKSTIEILRPRSDFVSGFVLPTSFILNALPQSNHVPIQHTFILNATTSGVYFKLKQNRTIPENGNTQLYFQQVGIFQTPIRIIEYNITWLSTIKCSLYLHSSMSRNDPFLMCSGGIQRPIVYKISNPIFKIINNFVYLEEITASGLVNFTITAMYEKVTESKKSFEFSIVLEDIYPPASFLSFSGCNVKFDFSSLRYKSLYLSNVQLGLNVSLQNRPGYTVTLPANQTTIFKLNHDGSTSTLKAVSPEVCCTNTNNFNATTICSEISLICPGKCAVSSWPDYKDFYKFRECQSCQCSYCYVGNIGRSKTLSIPMGTSLYQMVVQLPNVSKSTIKLVLTNVELQTRFTIQSPSRNIVPLPLPWNGIVQKYFSTDMAGTTVFIIKTSTEIFPVNEKFQIFLATSSRFPTITLLQYDITGTSDFNCSVSYPDWKFLNDPLSIINCNSSSQKPIIFNLLNTNFQMKNNSIFLKELTARGTFNFRVIAMYEGLKASQVPFNISLKLEGEAKLNVTSFIEVYGCRAVINTGLLNVTGGYVWNANETWAFPLLSPVQPRRIVDLLENQTNVMSLTITKQNMTFSITVKSSEICCKQESISRASMCYTFQFSCVGPCVVSKWPVYSGFYKTAKCGNCSCLYCDIDDNSETLMLPVPLKSSTHLLAFTTRYGRTWKFNILRPRRDFLSPFLLKNSTMIAKLPLPWNSFFNISIKAGFIYYINPLPKKILPRFGNQSIYLRRTPESGLVIEEYKLSWYSPPPCIISYASNDPINWPLLNMVCENPWKLPIVFDIKNPLFQMKGHSLFLKELTTRGSFNFSITAMFKDLKDSQTTLNVSLQLSELAYPDIVTLTGCFLTINTYHLNFSSLMIFNNDLLYNQTFSYNPAEIQMSLSKNKTYQFLIKDEVHPPFTLTVTSPNVCCYSNITYYTLFGCYQVHLNCLRSCSRIYPETNDFYLLSVPSNCFAIYCYRGGNGGIFRMEAPQETGKYFYNVTMPSLIRQNRSVGYLIGSQNITLQDSLHFYNFKFWSEAYVPYFEVILNQTKVLLRSNSSTDPPPEGSFNLTTTTINPGFSNSTLINRGISNLILNITDYKVFVFKKVNCTVERIDHNELWPSPAYKFNCINALNIKLNYTNYISGLTLKDGILYIIRPYDHPINTSIGFFYDQLFSSISVYPFYIPLKQYFISMKILADYRDWSTSLWGKVERFARIQRVSVRPGRQMDFLLGASSIIGVLTKIQDFYSKNELQILDYFAPVGELFITNLTASQNSKQQYIFKCATNSSRQDLTYEWYWDEVQVLRGLSSSMVNGFSQGTVVFDQLKKSDSGKVTCYVRSKNLIPALKSKNTFMNKFPLVNLSTTSKIIQNQNPVTVSCYLLPGFNFSSLVFKIDNQQILKNTATIRKESDVSCYGINSAGRGPIERFKISMAVGKKICKAEKLEGVTWPTTVAETKVNASCTKNFSGTITRLCSVNGIWDSPDKSECTKLSIVDAKSILGRVAIGIQKNFEEAVEKLANATKESMDAKDISETIKALDIASEITNSSKEINKNEVKGFVNVVNNLVKEDTQEAWTKLEEKNKLTASTILKKMENFGNIASKKVNETVVISTPNLIVEFDKVNVIENIQFPSPNSTQPKWVKESKSQVFIPSSILKDEFGANETVPVNTILFRNINELLPTYKNATGIVNSYILSISVGKPLENLTDKISLNFSYLDSGYENPSCSFWDFDINPELGGYWSNRGCEVLTSKSNFTVCVCDHLTNFAILMNPASHRDSYVLGIITKVGCSISIIALILTIIIYAICWKYVTSQDVTKSQSILLINLCVSLIIAYLIFMLLVEGPREKNVCTAIAALIQYFFLVVFFTMLAEGIDMAIALTIVFTAKYARLPWLLVMCWVAPAVIVGISLASTMTKGFGNDKFCWLTPKDNVIWSFIVPALLIILANFVCLILIIKALLSTYFMLRESVKDRLRAGARAIGILTPLLGFTWVFGVFAVNEDLIAFEYIFTISTSLQGLFIFISYCVFNKQIRKHLWKREKPASQVTTKPTTQSTSENTKETTLANFGKKYDANSESVSLGETSEIDLHKKPSYYPFKEMALRSSDNGLRKSITPYYINPSDAWKRGNL